MVSNIIKLSLGSLLVFVTLACTNKSKNNKNTPKKIFIDTCGYYRYNAGQIISNLSCDYCHIKTEKRLNYNIPTFGELSNMDSLKIISYAFTKRHGGGYTKNGAFKTSRMDTLSDCEIKSVIRYIKDFGRDIPISSP